MLERLEVDLTKIRIFPVLKPDFLPAMQILHFGTTRFGLSITWEFQNRKACPRDIQNANLALASLCDVREVDYWSFSLDACTMGFNRLRFPF